MMYRKTHCLLGTVLLAVGCSEITSPIDGTSFKRANVATMTTIAVVEAPETSYDGMVPPTTVVQAFDAPALMTYSTSFVAIQGQTKMFNLYYKNPDTGQAGDRFLYVEIPWDAQLLRADGTPAAPGEQVEITLDVDPVSFFVQFGPHGSTFLGSSPAELWFNYRHAEDEGHERDTPTIWYQPTEGEQWEDQGTTVRQRGKWLYVEIKHFSNYAVAW